MKESTINRQWLLRERPKGEINTSIFEYRETPKPTIAEQQVLVRTQWFSFDPAQRTWMEPVPTYIPPVALGEPMRASALGIVEESKHPDYAVGSRVQGLFNWADYIVAEPGQLNAPAVVDPAIDPQSALHLLGATGLTAWAGIHRVGKVQANETVVVSAAAGATGSIAAQLAKQSGARVIGIAGSAEKCKWLTQTCGLDGTINYRTENLSKAFEKLCPDGINVFFDNVGGTTLDAVFKHAAQRGRIVICGQIAHYQAPPVPFVHFMQIIVKSLEVKGFLVFDYWDQAAEAYAQLSKYARASKIHTRYDVQRGFKNIPETMLRLFSGKNNGKQLLENDTL